MPSLPPWAMRAILGVIGVAMIATGGAMLWHEAPVIGPAAAQHRLTTERDTARKAADDNRALAIAWAKSAGKSEGLRSREKTEARAAVNAEANSCTARVTEARRSALAIRSITRQETPRDPQGCPTRAMLPEHGLRDALQPARPPG